MTLEDVLVCMFLPSLSKQTIPCDTKQADAVRHSTPLRPRRKAEKGCRGCGACVTFEL